MNLDPIYLRKKWTIAIRLVPILIGLFLIKLLLHYQGWECLSLSPLFTSLIAANTFLIGFLITGIMSDYKEGEKIPGEIATVISSISDEALCIRKSKNSPQAAELLSFLYTLTSDIVAWFYKKNRSLALMEQVRSLNDHIVALESQTQTTFLNRVKQEQTNLRRLLTRAHATRDVSFILPAYAIVDALAFFLIVGQLTLKMEPYWESMFFVWLVSFLVLYMRYLIKDMDNPFDYKAGSDAVHNVSLKPLTDLQAELGKITASAANNGLTL